MTEGLTVEGRVAVGEAALGLPRTARLIAFCGLKGAGKDTAAAVFASRSYQHLKMADGLKAMLQALLFWQGVSLATAQRMVEGDLKEQPSVFLGGRSPRHAMQTLGTEWGLAHMAPDFWVQIAAERIRASLRDGSGVVISDVRFPNEAAMVRGLGGLVVRVEREGQVFADGHESEAGVAALRVDKVLANDGDDIAQFQAQVERWLFPMVEARG